MHWPMVTKTIVTLHHEETITYKPHSKDKTNRDIGGEVLRRTLEETNNERHVSDVLKVKEHPFCLIKIL